jgi:hypothetical protein
MAAPRQSPRQGFVSKIEDDRLPCKIDGRPRPGGVVQNPRIRLTLVFDKTSGSGEGMIGNYRDEQ